MNHSRTSKRLRFVATAMLVCVCSSSFMAMPAYADSDCLRSENPTIDGYASGAECPPVGFPYEPAIDITKAGMRAMDPHTDGCSTPVRRVSSGATFDFNSACATHDYMADLQRFGTPGVSEADIDHKFLQDMLSDCGDRNLFSRANCRDWAYTYRAFVQEGDYALGDEIETGS